MGLAEAVETLRDSIYDRMILKDEVKTVDILQCAFLMLQVNYDLTRDETYAVLRSCDQDILTDIVVDKVLFNETPAHRETYTYWARTALVASGLDPRNIDRADLAGVLRHLVTTGRAIPHSGFTAMAKARAERDNILG